MKKLYVTLALVLCLVLCVFAFASCDKKGKKASTTAAEKTDCAHAWGDFVVDLEPTCADPGIKSKYCTICGAQDPNSVTEIEPLPHTERADYTVDTPATCSAEGYESKHCAVCGQIIASTVRKINKDPKTHDVESWVTTEPTLLAPDGNRSGVCKLCGTNVHEPLALTTYVFNSTWDKAARTKFNKEYGVDWLNNSNDEGDNGIYIKKNINDVKRKDEHYYPDESNNNLGNDLLLEVSFLWNSTLAGKGSQFTFADGDGYDVFNVGSTIEMKIREGYEYGYINPTNPNSSAAHPSIGEYGWHRLGFRIHQDAEIVGTDEKSVKYTYVATAYLDGAEILKFDLTDWVTKSFKNTVTGLLYIAYIDENENLAFDDVAAGPHSGFTNSNALLLFEDFFTGNSYCVFTDLEITCGHNFVQNVEANADPAAADNFVLDDKGTPDNTTDDVTCPAKIWYKAKSN